MKFLCLVVLFFCAVSISHGLNCYKCSGDKCLNINELKPEACGSADYKYCLTKNDDNKISRVCATTENADKCKDPTCTKCTEDGCNKHTVCKKCDSSNEPKCLKPTELVPLEICDSDVKCLTQITEGKHTERKCAPSKEFKCTEDKTKPCELCEGSNCNVEVFPKDRLTCYECEDCNDITSFEVTRCSLYEPEDKCYSYGASETSMTRGCFSNPHKACTEETTKDQCLKCDNKDCNTVKYKLERKLKCVQCDAADEKCRSGYKFDDAKVCKNQVKYWQQEQCFVETSADGKIARGCVADREENAKPCTKENGCLTCTVDGCNNDDIKDAPTCIRCRSTNSGEESCSESAEGLVGKQCDKSISSDADKGCFTDRLEDKVVIRGCIVDYDVKAVANCKDNNYKKCDFCNDSNDCNKKKAPNSAAGLGLSAVFLAISALLVLVR